MSEQNPDVRLALLEQSVEELISLVKELAADVKKAADSTTEIAILRSEQTRFATDLSVVSGSVRSCKAEMNERIDRSNAKISEVDAKHQNTMGRLWFWQGAAWGAGGVIFVTIGLLTWMGKEAYSDLQKIKMDIHRIELHQTKEHPQ